MRVAISPHHTNPRSSTLDFWRKTTDIERYRVIQAQKKKQINIPTRFFNIQYFGYTLNHRIWVSIQSLVQT